jgi:hypothetical protein
MRPGAHRTKWGSFATSLWHRAGNDKIDTAAMPQEQKFPAIAVDSPPRECFPPDRRLRVEKLRAWQNHTISFAICLVLAVLFTLPTSISLKSGLLGYSGDNFQHAWFLWHFARSVAHFQNPFYTKLIYYPVGANLSWSTLDPLAGIIALPFSLAFGPVVAYNLSIILQLALAAFFARLLCLQICHDEIAALIGGACFGFSPFLLAHALGHLSLVTAFPIPLYLIALDSLVTARNPSWKHGVLLGLALLLTALSHYNYTVICVALTILFLLVELALQGPAIVRRTWQSFSWAAATFLLAFSPLLMMMLGNAADRPSPRPLDHIRQYSADVFGILIPSWNHILFGRFARGFDLSLFVAGYEGTVYIGPVILVLAALGFAAGRTAHRRWTLQAAILAVVFYVLSLGPALRFVGRQTSIAGPAALLYRLPFASFVSAPARFHVVTALSLAILGSLGVAYLLNRFRNGWQQCALVAAISAVLLLDLLTIPFPRSSPLDPAWSAESGAPPRACFLPLALQHGTVITFPLIIWPYSMKSMWMQVVDNGRYALVDGYVSYNSDRIWQDYYRNPVVRSLFSLQGEFHTPVDAASDHAIAPAALRELNATAIVVFDSPPHDAAVRYLQSLLLQSGQSAGSCTVFAIDGPKDRGVH